MDDCQKKVLFVATVVKTHINAFHLPYLKLLKSHGFTTYVCAKNDYEIKENCIIPFCDHFTDIPFSRNPISWKNAAAYSMLKKVIQNNEFDIIHCHTPVGGAITRLIARNIPHIKARIIYTAHGFHFYKGAPWLNWMVFYPVEKWLSKYTDTLITMNQEDYGYAKSFQAARVEMIHGIGIDIPKFSCVSINQKQKRSEFNLSDSDIILLSTGELIKRKNHSTVIKAIAKINNPHIKYFICGSGKLKYSLDKLIHKLHLEKQVTLLGFRTDISDLCAIADVFIFPSIHEGLPVALMEAMAGRLPIIASDIRGNRDLIPNKNGGILLPPKSILGFSSAIKFLINNRQLQEKMADYNYENIQKYSLNSTLKQMEKIYFENFTESYP